MKRGQLTIQELKLIELLLIEGKTLYKISKIIKRDTARLYQLKYQHKLIIPNK